MKVIESIVFTIIVIILVLWVGLRSWEVYNQAKYTDVCNTRCVKMYGKHTASNPVHDNGRWKCECSRAAEIYGEENE